MFKKLNPSSKLSKKLLHEILIWQSPFVDGISKQILRIALKGKEFDPISYRAWRGELLTSEINPYTHALLYGVNEKFKSLVSRQKARPSKATTSGDPTKDWVLVVTHDSTRTGAPILALSLIKHLRQSFNVASVSLGVGPLFPNFNTESNLHISLPTRSKSDAEINRVLASLSKKISFEFAILNSIESVHLSEQLKRLGIKSISLVHEFMSYSSLSPETLQGIESSNKIIFSSELTKDDFLATRAFSATRADKVLVIPQGKSNVPKTKIQENEHDNEFRSQIDSLLGELGKKSSPIFLGAGFVQYRKGVDLFIEMARKIINLDGFESSKFIWVGDGYHPAADVSYSSFLKDQIERSGLREQLSIIPSSFDFDYALSRADVFVLSSRLDPLPNVVMDALDKGLPIAFFEKASGFQSYCNSNSLIEEGCAEYMNVSDLANRAARISKIVTSQHGNEQREKLIEFAKQNFNFTAYTAKIIGIADGVKEDD
jgi:glycosyltransferase involved in cell wall biosynthesis